MNGRLIAILLIVSGLGAGVAMYWLQVYAYYRDVELGPPETGGVTLYVETEAGPQALDPMEFRGIDASSSPIRFRACFRVEDADATLAHAVPAADAVPLNAPGWFDCFDAARIGADLAAGRAAAVLGQPHVIYGIDRLIAVYPDGRAFAWDQINRCGEDVFDGNPPPPGCPPPEPRT